MSTSDRLPFADAYNKLKILISQGQFELLLPPSGDSSRQIRLVYLMNDAAESFLVFHNAELTGNYQPDFEGDLSATFSSDETRYVLIVHQGDNVCTLFFQNLTLETYLFDYGKTGHFWVSGQEYLRQMEFRIAILRDKLEYLGEDDCSDEEIELAALAGFPPLNFCCYPAVPDTYLVPSSPWWKVSPESLELMKRFAQQADDANLLRWLAFYEKFPRKIIARHIARLLSTTEHAPVVDLINRKLTIAASIYPERVFDAHEEALFQPVRERAAARKKELEQQGMDVVLLKEEPFVYAKDSVTYKLHLMIWHTKGKYRTVTIETFASE